MHLGLAVVGCLHHCGHFHFHFIRESTARPTFQIVGVFNVFICAFHSKFMCTFLQSGAAGCVKDFVTYFLQVPFACLGHMAAAVQPKCL